MNDTITKEQVINAYNDAPDFVRAAFNDEKTTMVIMGLQKKHELHVDSAGILAKEVGYFLLGIIDSKTFVNRLKSNNFPDQKVSEIMAELNEKIFVPLREQIKVVSTAQKQPLREAEEGKGEVAGKPSPKPAPAEVVQEEKPKEIVRLVVPQQPSVPSPLPAMLAAKKSPSSSELLEDHEEPHIELGKVPVAPSPVPLYVHTIQSKPLPLPTPAPVITSYSTDPYREPVDESPVA